MPERTVHDRPDSSHLLWYPSPAERWFEALPIGNGRCGGMVYSGHHVERIQLAETTAWSGAPAATDVSPSARAMLPKIRELLFAGRNGEIPEQNVRPVRISRSFGIALYLRPLSDVAQQLRQRVEGFLACQFAFSHGISGLRGRL